MAPNNSLGGQTSQRFLAKHPIKKTLGLALACAVLLSGCMVGPDFKQPAVSVNEQWQAQTGGDFVEAVELVRDAQINPVHWWQQFDDATLSALLLYAGQQNLTLQSAALRIYQARAQLGISDAALLPTAAAGASGTTSDSSTSRDALLQANWELDFWGKYRRGIESSFSSFQSAIAAYYSADVSLTATVANTYINIRNVQELIRVAQVNLTLQAESLRIARARYQAGSTSLLALSQAQTRYQQTKAEIPGLIEQLNRQRNAMSVLLGQRPGFYESEFGQANNQLQVPEVLSVGIPRDLLRRRPDVAAAEYRAASQSALIGMREADLYPSFSLSGIFGYLSTSVSYQNSPTMSSEGTTSSATGSVSLPLFYRGAIVDQVRVQDAVFEQSVLDYQNTVLVAQSEVEDALMRIATAKSAVKDFSKALGSARQSAALALDLYEAGQSDYNTVIVAQQTLLQVQSDLVQSKTNTLLGYVDAFKALGGGWDAQMTLPTLPNELISKMKARTNWGDSLDSASPSANAPRLVQTLGLTQ
jgi:NodT family efflux transporter outer membrane factor (OMF) lipoprotein